MNKLLFGFAVLPFLVGVASAADRLGDGQLDQIRAGALNLFPTCGGAAGCGSVLATSTASVTTATDAQGTVTTTATATNGTTCVTGCSVTITTNNTMTTPSGSGQGSSPGSSLGSLVTNGALSGLGL